jgi:hypothetical protein
MEERKEDNDIAQIGHVLGMVHKQCRNDRDSFIQYRCQNIRGYGKSLTNAINAGETDLDTKLCVDKTFAKKYNFDGSQFTKNAQYADLPGILDEAEFDMGSIMMYPSNAFSNPECWPKSMDKVDGKVTGMSWIHGSLAPSAGEEVVSLGWYWR